MKLHVSLLAYLELNFCILSSISVLNSAHHPTPMRPMTSLPLAASSAKWWDLFSSFGEVAASGDCVSQLASDPSWGRAWADSEELQVPPSSLRALCWSWRGSGRGHRGSRQPLETQREEMPDCLTGTMETTPDMNCLSTYFTKRKPNSYNL